MKFAFKKMRLEADSLYSLIMTWIEMQLFVTKDGSYITGYGYYYEIAGAFTNLVFDWEAYIYLPQHKFNLEEGVYGVATIGEDLYAFKDQKKYYLGKDGPVIVEVISVPEEIPGEAGSDE
jgi:hypothetical protein